MKTILITRAPLLLATLAALFLPLFLSSFYVHIMVLMVIFAVFAMSLDVLMGYTGLPSLGHAAFYGMGAYASGLMGARYGGTWWEGILLAMVCTTLLAAFFGVIALRARGLYFMLISLAFAQVMWGAANRWGSFTGGYNGLRGIPKHLEILGSTVGAYYFSLAIAVVLALVMYAIVRSPFGLTLQGIRESETRMQALGYNVWLHKYAAFIISAVFAGFSGTMSAYYKGFVSPFDLSIALSMEAILMVILGGTGTLFGAVIGAVILVALRNFLSILLQHWLIVLGLIFILTVFFAPEGVVGWFTRRGQGRSGQLLPMAGTDTDEGESESDQPAFEIGIRPANRTADTEGILADLELENVTKSFGGVRALNDVSLRIQSGDRIAVLGPNGAGKTSLFHLISGSLRPNSGKISLFGRDVSRLRIDQRVGLGLGRTFQITNLFPALSVIDNLRLALFSYHSHRFTVHRSAESLTQVTEEARGLLEIIGLGEVSDIAVRHLSYGEQRQLEVIMAVALRPRLLLLDEPTAGLSVVEGASIVNLIRSLDSEITLLIIEHDMDVAFEVADKIIVFHQGEKLAEGTKSEIRANSEVRRIYLGRS